MQPASHVVLVESYASNDSEAESIFSLPGSPVKQTNCSTETDVVIKKEETVTQEAKDDHIQEEKRRELARLKRQLARETLDLTQLRNYKPTDFRRDLLMQYMRRLRRVSELSRAVVAVRFGQQPRTASVLTVDSSSAGSNTDVLRLCLQELGWREYPHGQPENPCDLHWSSTSFSDSRRNGAANCINKFPGMNRILQKINLSRTLETMKRLFPEDYDFYPATWRMPRQFMEFNAHVKELRRTQQENALSTKHQATLSNDTTTNQQCFIVKPDHGSQGEGIFLIYDPSEYKISSQNHIIQEYLTAPLLLDGFKFDLRVYVLIKSLEPLEVLICREGLARLCSKPYFHPNRDNLRDPYVHLTNYSLNKSSSTYVHSTAGVAGCKRTISNVMQHLQEKGYNTTTLWTRVEELVIKTVIAILPEIKVHFEGALEEAGHNEMPVCFQLLGFDIIVLDNLRIKLLEVNANPSLRIDYQKELAPHICEYFPSVVDINIKKPLLLDILKVIRPTLASRRMKCKQRTSIQSDKSKQSISASNTDGTVEADSRDVIELHDTNKDSLTHNSDEETVEENTLKRATQDENENWALIAKSENRSCLKIIYPGYNEHHFKSMRILENLLDVFHEVVGARTAFQVEQEAFRNFARKCKLGQFGLTMAAIDILYIYQQRQWPNGHDDHNKVGVPFQIFAEIFVKIALQKFHHLEDKTSAVRRMIVHCQRRLGIKSQLNEKTMKKKHSARLAPDQQIEQVALTNAQPPDAATKRRQKSEKASHQLREFLRQRDEKRRLINYHSLNTSHSTGIEAAIHFKKDFLLPPIHKMGSDGRQD